MKNVTCPAHYPRTLGHRTQPETRSTNDEPACTLGLPFRWTVMKWTYRDADIYDDGINVTTIIICLPQLHDSRRHPNPTEDSVKSRSTTENKEKDETMFKWYSHNYYCNQDGKFNIPNVHMGNFYYFAFDQCIIDITAYMIVYTQEILNLYFRHFT